MRQLTQLQDQFCHEYLKDGVIEASAIRAGYNPASAGKTAYKLLRNPLIEARIRELRVDSLMRLKLDADQIVSRFIAIADKAEQSGDLHVALRALELIGKRLGIFTDKLEVTQKNPFVTGEDEEALKRDAERMLRIARPALAIVGGTDTT